MSITVSTNISSLVAQRSLYRNTSSLSVSLGRMSTGLKINSSKDDAAGYAISNKMNYEKSSYSVAKSNAQMGQSMIDTANGSLNTISNMLHRMRDLAEQSANGTYGAEERAAMQSEVEGLKQEIYRVKDSTEFNGKKILGTETVKQVTEKDAIAQGYKTVHNAQELKEALKVNDAKVMIFADINLDDLGVDETGSNWTAVGSSSSNAFQGTLDGNGYTISNLKINKPDRSYQGLFGYTKGATIKNIDLENVDITSNAYGGGL
ncbi:hypothetical protein IKE67_10195 [bacterium]|nr:hypothetical protein [bacterium]